MVPYVPGGQAGIGEPPCATVGGLDVAPDDGRRRVHHNNINRSRSLNPATPTPDHEVGLVGVDRLPGSRSSPARPLLRDRVLSRFRTFDAGGVAAYELIVDTPAGSGGGAARRLVTVLDTLSQQLCGDAAVEAEPPFG